MQDVESGMRDVACDFDHISMPSGIALVPVSFVVVMFSSGKGPGKRKVSAMPASVAKPMNGMVKMSIPKDTCLSI